MFNFLKGRLGGFGGGGLGQQAGGGFMDRMRQNMQRPQLQQAAGAIGAQMLGFDPALGMAAAQGMQQRRLNQGFNSAITPIQRQQIDPRQFMPQQRPRFDLTQLQRLPMPQQRQRFDLSQLHRLPMQQQMTGVIRNPLY